MMLSRTLANIYIPPVNVLNDSGAMTELMELHIEQKMLFKDLVSGGINHEEILEALEASIGTKHMDAYIIPIESQLDKLETNVLRTSNQSF